MHKPVYAYDGSLLHHFQMTLSREGFISNISPRMICVWSALQSPALKSPKCLLNMQIPDPTAKKERKWLESLWGRALEFSYLTNTPKGLLIYAQIWEPLIHSIAECVGASTLGSGRSWCKPQLSHLSNDDHRPYLLNSLLGLNQMRQEKQSQEVGSGRIQTLSSPPS